MRPKIPVQNPVMEAPVAKWQAIYCSFALILVVFFVMMVSFSVVSGKGMKAIRKHFARGSSLHAPGSSMAPLSGVRSEESGEVTTFVIRDATSRFGLGNAVSVRMASGGIDINMKDRVIFASESTDLEKRIYPYLNVIGDVAARNGLHIQVKVRTPDMSTNGLTDRSAWDLSSRRAVNVMRYFLAYGRLAPDQVSAAGFISKGSSSSVQPDNVSSAEGQIEMHLSVNE